MEGKRCQRGRQDSGGRRRGCRQDYRQEGHQGIPGSRKASQEVRHALGSREASQEAVVEVMDHQGSLRRDRSQEAESASVVPA